MPIYTYRCNRCGVVEDHVESYAERDQARVHEPTCSGSFLREDGLERPTVGKAAYQMQAVLGNGLHVKGHFGKSSVSLRRGCKL